jgi:riboflavin kinase / FMN adenylyltransferase
LTIFNSITDFETNKNTVVTLGSFDGVHIGHQQILKKLGQTAANDCLASVVLTFAVHPRMVLQKEPKIKLLNSIDEKTSLLAKSGVENLIIHPFDADFAALSAADFVEKILVEKLKVKKIIIGHDHRFGKNRSANIDDLIVFGKEFDFEVAQISAQEIDEIAVSSTKIRNALQEGNLQTANAFLGYAYQLSGQVILGKQLGRTIGFPTANIKIDEADKMMPKTGVYCVSSIIEGKMVFGMLNIGFNPTVAGESLSVEVHFFDFDAHLYDQKITLNLHQYLREEQKFDTVLLLKQQLEKDKLASLSYFKNLNYNL